MASFGTAGASAANQNPNKSVEVRVRAPAAALPGEKKKTIPRVRFNRVVFPLSVTGDSRSRGLGVQPQLQPQGEPPRFHLMGQPGEVPAVVRSLPVYAEIYLLFLF